MWGPSEHLLLPSLRRVRAIPIVHGWRFLYGTTLGRSAMRFALPLAKEPSTLPVILESAQYRARSLSAPRWRTELTVRFRQTIMRPQRVPLVRRAKQPAPLEQRDHVGNEDL